MKPLVIIPTFVRQAIDVEVFTTTLKTLRDTASDRCEVIVVDDGSPARDLVAAIDDVCERYEAALEVRDSNDGFSAAVNVGLRQALADGRDAILVNADIEFGLTADWLEIMCDQRDSHGEPAAIVGALLVYPGAQLIQHGGIFFSLLSREFGHRFQYGPANLPEAQVPTICPVTGALQFIRHDCLCEIGLYDESFGLGWEDVDVCIRTFLAGGECVYQPAVRAVHHESFFRGRVDDTIAQRTERSWMRFCAKWAGVSFAQWVPNMLGV